MLEGNPGLRTAIALVQFPPDVTMSNTHELDGEQREQRRQKIPSKALCSLGGRAVDLVCVGQVITAKASALRSSSFHTH